MSRKHYTGPLIDVTDDRELGIHSTECVRGMTAVFDTSHRPWINPTAADTPTSPTNCGPWSRGARLVPCRFASIQQSISVRRLKCEL